MYWIITLMRFRLVLQCVDEGGWRALTLASLASLSLSVPLSCVSVSSSSFSSFISLSICQPSVLANLMDKLYGKQTDTALQLIADTLSFSHSIKFFVDKTSRNIPWWCCKIWSNICYFWYHLHWTYVQAWKSLCCTNNAKFKYTITWIYLSHNLHKISQKSKENELFFFQLCFKTTANFMYRWISLKSITVGKIRNSVDWYCKQLLYMYFQYSALHPQGNSLNLHNIKVLL